jgi:glycerophosphoryl diester phosphodiesterase
MTDRSDRTQPKALRLLRGDGPVLKIGHRGAALLAPANTIAAVEAALEHGADLVELDVFSGQDGKLVLSHSRRELTDEPVTLDEMLAYLAERAPETGVLTDLKFAGRERALVASLQAHGFVDRALACTSRVEPLQNLRRLEPELARSLTYPRGRVYLGGHRTFIHVSGPVQWAIRVALPHRVRGLVEEVGASAMTLNHRAVTRATVERCHELGVAVFAWTVNEAVVALRLDELGVDGVITDDPRILTG